MPLLLIATVGSSPEPVAASLASRDPEPYETAIFICSPDTLPAIALGISGRPSVLELARALGCEPRPSQYDIVTVHDPQDLNGCVETLRRALDARVHAWRARGAAYCVAADFTGGTKCMSVALGLAAQRWDCIFRYVGGDERTGGRVGIVVNGREQIVYGQNPWDALGYEAAERAITLFDNGDCAAAARLLTDAKKNASAPHVKRSLAGLEAIAEAFALWDRFDHSGARVRLANAAGASQDLAWFFGDARAAALRRECERWIAATPAAADAETPTIHLLTDLLANARRRLREGRFDDAAARLYRSVELMAQLRLGERGLRTRSIPIDSIPEACRETFAGKSSGGAVTCGLQDSYRLLKCFGDPLGEAFARACPDARASSLEMRNQSILAHGFQSVGETGCKRLWDLAWILAQAMGLTEQSLPNFPKLRAAGL